MKKYILKGHTPVIEEDEAAWGRWHSTADRSVARDVLPNGWEVSTVFLGIDHSSGIGPPALFETRIFGRPGGHWRTRCATWTEAEAMHRKALRRVDPLYVEARKVLAHERRRTKTKRERK